MTRQLILCGHVSPIKGAEPCALEQGHEGGHVFWGQSRPHARRGRNGVSIFDDQGETIMHATFVGAAQAEDICALLALSDLVKRKRLEERA